ncbi:hypothetical protein SMCF_7257 [Streptomyces coelicoflavus ZG0656]|nr:hypothetical protein SMCF_7257 [Streptomyces coelicoflavus ZG0656]
MSVRRFMIVQLLALFMCGTRRDSPGPAGDYWDMCVDYGLQPVARTP